MKKTLSKIAFTTFLLGLSIPTMSYAEENKQEVPWGIKKIQADVSHMQNLTGKNVKIAVIDSGIYTHEDLEVENAINFVDDTLPTDNRGHGTHVSGIIAAKDNNKGIVGVAPDAEVYMLKIISGNNHWNGSSFKRALDWCEENDIDIINMSFEIPLPDEIFSGTSERLKGLRDKGVLLVAAAGNGGRNSLSFPANHPSVISVGSIDENEELASSSNYGKELDVVAPGVGICSSFFWETTLNELASKCDKVSGDNYGKLSGTSQATPHVTGVLALLKEKYPNATADELEEKIKLTTKDLGDSGRDEKFGYGLVQAPKREKEEYENLNKITKNTTFRSILEENVSQIKYLFDIDTYYSTTFYKNGKLMYRFENPMQPIGFNIVFPKGIEEQSLSIAFYDFQQNLLKKIPITKSGTYLFDKLDSDMYYFQIENTGSAEVKVNELEILGDVLPSPKKVFDLNSTMTVKSDNKTIYEDIQSWANGIEKKGLLNKTLTVTKGSEWNDDYNQYSKVMVTNEELGIKDKWIDVNLKSGEMRPIYETDLTSTMNGQIVKNEDNNYVNYINDDSLSYPPTLYPNKKYTYEFDYPVSVNGYYFNYIHNRLGNKLKLTLTNTEGYEFPLEVDDTALFYRHMSFPIDYENIEKITIENKGTEEFKLYEFALIGRENENKTFPAIDIQHPIGLSWRGFKLYDYPNSPTYTSVSIPDNKTVYSKKGYALNASSDIFKWMQIEWNGELKWVSYNDVNMEYLFKNGLINSVGGTVLPEKNAFWTYYIFNDYGIPGTIYPEGFAEYEFNAPVSIKEMYFSSGDYIDNSDNKLVLELSDKDKNVVYTRNISRNDLYRKIIPFGTTYENIKYVKILNKGQYNSKILKVNFK